MNIIAQVTTRSIEYKQHPDLQRDTLLVDGKIYLLEVSFLNSFEGFRNLFKDNEVTITNLPQTRGFNITWKVIDGTLYFDHFKLANEPSYGSRNAEKARYYYKDTVSLAEIHKRLESLTGRKFNAQGLLKADWVTVQVKAAANGQYHRFIDSAVYESKEQYVFNFKEGKLESFQKL